MKTPAGYRRVKRKINAKKDRSGNLAAIGILLGLAAGCIYLEKLGQATTQFIVRAIEPTEISTHSPVNEESREATVTEDGAGQTLTPIDYTESDLIEQAVDEFLSNHKSESLMIMHCLAHREARHGESTGHGDNGLAGGPFQFHQATWDRMRTQMGEEMSSRYDFKEAARTTAWAIANGRAREWGPINRDSQGSNYAACQTPSWY